MKLCGCRRHDSIQESHYCARVMEIADRGRLRAEPLDTEESREEYMRLKKMLLQHTKPITDNVEIIVSRTEGPWRHNEVNKITTTAIIDSGAGIAGALIRYDVMKKTESPEFEFFPAEEGHQLETGGGGLAILGYTFRRLRWLEATRVIPCMVVPEAFQYETLIGRRALEDEWKAIIDFQKGTIKSALSNTVKRIQKPQEKRAQYNLEGCTVYTARIARQKHKCSDTLKEDVEEVLGMSIPQSEGEWREAMGRLRPLAGHIERVRGKTDERERDRTIDKRAIKATRGSTFMYRLWRSAEDCGGEETVCNMP